MDLEEVWRIREEEIYPKLFGTKFRGIFTLDDGVFKQLGQDRFDPRWFSVGIFEFEPTEARSCWMYATSGLSNPWYRESESGAESDIEPDEISGFGMEFLQTILAYDILLYADCFPGRGPIGPGNRVSFNAPINHDPNCVLRGSVISHAEAFPAGFALPSGEVEFFTVTGVANDEIRFGQANSTAALIERLAAAGAYPVTDPARHAVPLSE